MDKWTCQCQCRCEAELIYPNIPCEWCDQGVHYPLETEPTVLFGERGMIDRLLALQEDETK